MELASDTGGAAGGANQPDRSNDQSKPLSKMTSGGEDLRDHDFPVQQKMAGTDPGPVAIDTHAPPPETVHSGGKQGEMDGDTQRVGSVGAVIDQVAAEPSTPVDR